MSISVRIMLAEESGYTARSNVGHERRSFYGGIEMADNPFTLHLARGEAFPDREQELADLLTYARNGQSVVLLSARRLGKSSLAGKVPDGLH
jgi:hypothetical protein